MASAKYAFLWNGLGTVGQFFISFVSSVLIARILSPEDYGLIGVLTIFTALTTLLIDSGFKDVLILNGTKNTKKDFSTVFIVNFTISLFLYFILYISASFIATYFESQQLKIISRILFLSLLTNAISIVPLTILTIRLEFKTIAIINTFSGFIVALIGLLLAYNGAGVWSLIYPSIITSLFRVIAFWYFSNWRPTLCFDLIFIKKNFYFSIKLLITRIFESFSNNIITVLIGKFYSLNEVGFYNRANNLQLMPNNIIVSSINQVSYPILSKTGNSDRFKKFKKLIKASSMITFPVSIGLIFIGKPLILLLLTEKWSSSIPLFQILCILISISLLSYLNNTIIKIHGKVNVLFWVSFTKQLITILLLLLIKPFGVVFMCYAIVLVNFFSFITYMYVTSKISSYKLINQLNDITPSLLISLIMGLMMYIISLTMSATNLIMLISQITIGFGFLLISYWFFFKEEKQFLLTLLSKK